MFDDKRLYPATDPALRPIACYATLAEWRCKGFGPAYIKAGSRVLYRGSALNEWLESCTVTPAEPPAA